MNTTDRLKELNNLFLRKTFPLRAATVSDYFTEHFDQLSYSERSFSRDLKALKEKLAERYPSLEETEGDLIRYSKSENRFYYIRDDISAFPFLRKGIRPNRVHHRFQQTFVYGGQWKWDCE